MLTIFKMKFTAKIRKIGTTSLVVTVPAEIVQKLSINEGDIEEFEIFKTEVRQDVKQDKEDIE